MAVGHVTDATFAAEVEQSSTPVLVDFWAEWCGPCRAMNPVLEEFSNAHANAIKVVKLNIDENPEAAARFQVMSIPTMLVFKDGQVVKQLVGAMQRPKLEEHLTEWIGTPA